MTSYPAVEHRESTTARWLRERRVRLSFLVALVESLLVIAGGLGWFWVLGAALVAVVAYFAIARRRGPGVVREVAWIAASSQLISALVPLLWELVKFLAVLVLAALALVLVALLLLDR